jgi:hypothetical protein
MASEVENEPNKAQCVRIGPLQIIEHQEQGPPGRQQRSCDGLEEPVPLPDVLGRRSPGTSLRLCRWKRFSRNQSVDLSDPLWPQAATGGDQLGMPQPIGDRRQ